MTKCSKDPAYAIFLKAGSSRISNMTPSSPIELAYGVIVVISFITTISIIIIIIAIIIRMDEASGGEETSVPTLFPPPWNNTTKNQSKVSPSSPPWHGHWPWPSSPHQQHHPMPRFQPKTWSWFSSCFYSGPTPSISHTGIGSAGLPINVKSFTQSKIFKPIKVHKLRDFKHFHKLQTKKISYDR